MCILTLFSLTLSTSKMREYSVKCIISTLDQADKDLSGSWFWYFVSWKIAGMSLQDQQNAASLSALCPPAVITFIDIRPSFRYHLDNLHVSIAWSAMKGSLTLVKRLNVVVDLFLKKHSHDFIIWAFPMCSRSVPRKQTRRATCLQWPGQDHQTQPLSHQKAGPTRVL